MRRLGGVQSRMKCLTSDLLSGCDGIRQVGLERTPSVGDGVAVLDRGNLAFSGGCTEDESGLQT